MRIPRRRLVAGLILLALLAPALRSAPAGGAAPARDEYSDPSQPIDVVVGQSFDIVLQANRTTGYQWSVTQPFDDAVVRLAGQSYQASNPGLIGAPGNERFTFQAVGPGTTALAFGYSRPWETGAAPLKEVAFTVNVHGGAPSPAVYTDPAQPIVVGAGQLFTIALGANHTTGYQWVLAQPVDAAVLNLVRQNYTPGQPGLPGAGGSEQWLFEAVAPGSAAITLNYVRPWEVGAAPARQAVFNVTVQ